MAGKECFEERFVWRNFSCVLCGPEQPQNFETRGKFIHLLRSCRSVMRVVSSVSEDGDSGVGSETDAVDMCAGSEESEAVWCFGGFDEEAGPL